MDTHIVEHGYIARKISGGEPIIKNTGVTVRAIAELWLQGAQPEEIVIHISHLSLAQVFDALSYYSDHKEEIDSFIKSNEVTDGLSGTHLS